MMEVGCCRHCGADTYSLDAVTICVEMAKSTYCSHCHQSHQDKHSVFFCSSKCLLTWLRTHEEEFLKEVAGFRAGRLWDRGFDPPADSGENAAPPQRPDQAAEH